MKRILTTLALVLAILLCTAAFALGESSTEYYLGGPIDDFTVTTWDGQTVTLSKLLEEKDMVLINIWATWCGPCQAEFPYMEEAYQQYQDDIAIVALTCEPTDTNDVLAEFVSQMGMSFYVAQDTVDMATKLYASAIPTTVVVDRNGVICFWHEGSVPDTASFCRLFDAFVGDDYTDSQILYELPAAPPMKPNVAPADEARLAEALGTDNAANPTGEYDWPMAVTEKDESLVVMSTNAGQYSSTAMVSTTVYAEEGSAIVITFKTSTEKGYDMMQISVNGNLVKSFGGEHDWMTWAFPVEESGEYTVTLAYCKDAAEDGGEDTIWVDSVAVATGAQARMYLSANPQYPVADETTLTLTNPEAQEVIFNDETGLLAYSFGDARYYVLNGDTADFIITAAADVEPEVALFYSDYDGSSIYLSDAPQAAGGYAMSAGVDTIELTGYPYTGFHFYLDPTGMNIKSVIYFADEENLVAFVDGYQLGTWYYAAEETPADTSEEPAADESPATPALSTFTVYYVDQYGAPVPGVMCQICDESSCQVITSDENGVVTLTTEPYPWEIHTLKVPEGYEGDTRSVTTMPAEGGELTLAVTNLNAPADADAILGDWRMTGAENMADAPDAMLLTFTEDQMISSIVIDGETQQSAVSYILSGNQIINGAGAGADYSLNGDELRISYGSETLIFTREGAVPVAETVPAATAQDSPLGTWNLVTCEGSDENAATINMVLSLDGSIQLIVTADQLTLHMSMMGMTEDETISYYQVGNTLCSDEAEDMPFTISGDEMRIVIEGVTLVMTREGAAPIEAAAPAAENTLVGTWNMTGAEGDEEALASSIALIQAMGGAVQIIFTETEMTFNVSILGQTETETSGYYVEGNLIYDDAGVGVEYSLEGDELRLTEEGATLVLTREGAEAAEAAEVVPGAPVEVTPAVLLGSWNLSSIEGSDDAALGMSMVTAMGGTVQFDFTETQMTLTMSFMGQTETETVGYYIENGKMYSDDDAVVDITFDGTELRMSQDGMVLVLTR